MYGKKAVGLAALALLAALTLPAAGRAWHRGCDDGSGAPNYDPPLYYPRTTYWVPLLHRCLAGHRPKSVSVYPCNDYPEIEGSYLVIKSPTSLIPRPWHLQTEAGAGCGFARDGRAEVPAVEVVAPAAPAQK